MLNYHDLMMVILLTLAASAAAFAGGLTAIRSRNKLQLVLALTSGLVLGLVIFDLLPEIFEIINTNGLEPVWPMIMFGVGFLAFHFIEKFILIHEGVESEFSPHSHPKLGMARALALAGHSFLDGLSIGVAFQISTEVGFAVALAVVGHRFADGFDTVNFMILHKNKNTTIRKVLAVVIIMPILGGLASFMFTLSEAALATYLGLFAGILMYIAASNILPQAHAKDVSYKLVALTSIGAAMMFVLTRFI